jgi:hypothetical protein
MQFLQLPILKYFKGLVSESSLKYNLIGNGAYSEVFRVMRYSDNKEYALKKV